MSADLAPFLARISEGHKLSAGETEDAVGRMMSGEADPYQISAFLMGLRMRGEQVSEIIGGARALRARVLAVEPVPGAIDTCGTGGDARGTYNISTAAAFVAAGCGVPVAKHGNKAATSKSGSSDVLSSLGVAIDLDPEHIRRCVVTCGIGFMPAPMHHAAMKHVAPVRAALSPVRTLFNLLGPLSNPAGARCQVLGVFSDRWLEPMAEALRELGTERAWVVHGSDGLDELTTTGPSHVAELAEGAVRSFTVTPEDAGLAPAHPEDLRGGTPEENALALRAVLDGTPGPYRDIVILNAAAALIVAGRAGSLEEGAALAAEAIDSGKARRTLDALTALSREKKQTPKAKP
ncbi:MAG: anthranilate phosphoribosyltransferase [Alphaproteobacteria bacterium]